MKRLFDLFFSTLGLVVLSPFLGYVAWRIHREDGGPVFYRGSRVGLGGKPFRIVKFRTMAVNAESLGGSSTADDDPRITVIGRQLRRHKLDELPQLINVFLGDMSFVGPRPQVQWAVDLYTPAERVILSVRPGITDYASLRFSNEGEILRGSANPDKAYLEKIHPLKTQLAMEYVRTHSFFLDLGIILKTIAAIILTRKDPGPDEKISHSC